MVWPSGYTYSTGFRIVTNERLQVQFPVQTATVKYIVLRLRWKKKKECWQGHCALVILSKLTLGPSAAEKHLCWHHSLELTVTVWLD